MKNTLLTNWFSRQKKNDIQSFDSLGNSSVLIVDDSRTQLYAMEKMLASVGIRTLTAENGKQGILMARHKKPDLILMDIVMPEINGFQATRYLTRQPDTGHIPIIIISGSSQGSDRVWGLKLGAKDFMQKPVDKHELLNKINYWIDDSKSRVASQSHESNLVQAV